MRNKGCILLLGAFALLEKVFITFIMYLCLSTRKE